jgi:integrase
VNDTTADVLERHRAQQAAERERIGADRWIDPELMFTNGLGGVLDQTNLATAFRARVKAAGVRPARWYDLRHSYGTHLIAAGEDAKTVASLMGHRDVGTTLRHYVHTDENRRRSAIETLASYREAHSA